MTAPYDGPYEVISKSGRVMKILIKGKVETVSIDRVKLVHFEREPGLSTNTKRQTQPKTMNPKPAAITHGHRKDRLRSSSTLTPKSVRTGVEPNTSTKTKSSALIVGTSPAITLQSQAHLPKPPTPYKAPHCRTPPPPTFLALTGTMAVCERTDVYLYTYGVKSSIKTIRKNIQMLEVA